MDPTKILIGCTGSVATVKIVNLVNLLKEEFMKVEKSLEIRLIYTTNARVFLPENLSEIQADVIYTDSDEWQFWRDKKVVLHIELAQNWADIFLIAPLDANTLAKLSNGLNDNLLTSVARAWDFSCTKKKILVAPAMNTKMWDHPVTSPQIGTLRSWGYKVISPIEKMLACKTFGMGAMAEVSTIVTEILKIM